MVKSKIIKTRLMPRSRFLAITLFGFIVMPKGSKETPSLVNHELIHCQQQLEWLYIPFFILYIIEYAINMIKYKNRDKAYRMISFEREAYKHQENLKYLNSRKLYANYRKD